MGSQVNQYQTVFEEDPGSAINRDEENVQSDSISVNNYRKPWTWNQSNVPGNAFVTTASGQSFSPTNDRLHPDRFLSSAFVHQTNEQGNDRFTRSAVYLSSKLPSWLWSVLSCSLGINDGHHRLDMIRIRAATFLHILTLATGICYGSCGLIFNLYDTISANTKTNALVCLAKSALGLFWILLGIYSHSLAARLFKSNGLLDYIRLHSKTFMKISTAIWISLLSVAIVAMNMYSNIYIIHRDDTIHKEKIKDPTCSSIGLPVILCQIYFTSKVIFSCFNLVWNLIVAAVCLSVCRTHTICIRRFMKELSYDSRIYEEFFTLKYLTPGISQRRFSDYDICDDLTMTEDEEPRQPSNGEHVLKSLRIIRIKKLSESTSVAENRRLSNVPESIEGITNARLNSETDVTIEVSELELKECAAEDQEDSESPMKVDFEDRGAFAKLKEEDEEEEEDIDLSTTTAPIMSNEDFMFTYFKILKNLSATSRLLQRWMSSWITFVMVWCILLIIYWVSHTAQLIGIFQFVGPLVVLGLLASAYAEVNFEGDRLIKFILPTEDRMPVIYYVNTAPLELKVYSFTMTYNVLVTVVAGVAVTFATRIILDNVF